MSIGRRRNRGLNMSGLEIVGDIATILTALVAVFGYGKYLRERAMHRVALEYYLRGQKDAGVDQGQRGIINIMAKTGLTEAEIFQASRDSRHIARRIKTEDPDEKNKLGKWLLFEYEGR